MINRQDWVKLSEPIEGLDTNQVYQVMALDEENNEYGILSFAPDHAPIKIVPIRVLALASETEVSIGLEQQELCYAWQAIGRKINEFHEGDIVIVLARGGYFGLVSDVSDTQVYIGDAASFGWHDLDDVLLVTPINRTFSLYQSYIKSLNAETE